MNSALSSSGRISREAATPPLRSTRWKVSHSGWKSREKPLLIWPSLKWATYLHLGPPDMRRPRVEPAMRLVRHPREELVHDDLGEQEQEDRDAEQQGHLDEGGTERQGFGRLERRPTRRSRATRPHLRILRHAASSR